MVDSRPAMHHQISDWFSEHGLKQPSYQEIMYQVCRNDLEGMLMVLLPENLQEERFVKSAVEEIDQSFVNYYMPKYAKEILNVNGFLTKLKDRFKVAIVTNASRIMLDYFLRNFKLYEIVNIAISADDVKYPKPSPEGILKAQHLLNESFSQGIYVGDTTTDILAGKAAGMKTVGVLSGIGSKEELESAGADFILENISHLESVL